MLDQEDILYDHSSDEEYLLEEEETEEQQIDFQNMDPKVMK